MRTLKATSALHTSAPARPSMATAVAGTLALCLVLGLLLPLATLLGRALYYPDGSFAGLANFARYYASPTLASSLQHTLVVSAYSAVLALILAFIYAYAVCRTRMPGRGILHFIAVVPLFAPSMMFGIALVYLLGNKGALTVLGLKLPLYGSLGIVISEVAYTFPQAYLILLAALSVTDARLYEAADNMGASALRQFGTITLPSVRYGLINAGMAAFILAFTDFGAPKIVGGNYNVLAVDMYKQVVGQQNLPMGAVVGILLLTPALVSFFIDSWARTRQEITLSSRSQPLEPQSHPVRDTLLGIYCALIALCILVLVAAVVVASLVKFWPYNLSVTLEHYMHRSEASGGMRAYVNSILVALVTAGLGAATTFVLAYVNEKTRAATWLRQATHFLAMLPLALPGLVIGLAYILFFNAPANPLNFVYGTPAILVLANIAHFASVPYLAAVTALRKLDSEFETVAESMAVPQWRTFLAVSVPLCLPTILENMVYFFTNAMVTISAVVFLYPSWFKLASIAIVNLEDAGDVAPAAAMSVLVIATNLVVRLLYSSATQQLRRLNAAWQRR